uniref:Uncharacterized protein n=1 Tax=Oryza glumipatula TaxID=40148 RepID=A0A0D9ZYA9_9ORYZ
MRYQVILAKYQVIPVKYQAIPTTYQEPGTNAPSLVVQPSTSHVRARRRRPHPPLSTTHHSSSPTAVSFVIHAPH